MVLSNRHEQIVRGPRLHIDHVVIAIRRTIMESKSSPETTVVVAVRIYSSSRTKTTTGLRLAPWSTNCSSTAGQGCGRSRWLIICLPFQQQQQFKIWLIHFLQVVPNHCWFQGHQYECGLSLSCVFSGSKPLDLCNGGMVWSCCVPRGRAGDDYDEDSFGVVNDPRELIIFWVPHLFYRIRIIYFYIPIFLPWHAVFNVTVHIILFF